MARSSEGGFPIRPWGGGSEIRCVAEVVAKVIASAKDEVISVALSSPWSELSQSRSRCRERRVAIGGDSQAFAVDVLPHPANNPWNCQMRLTGFDFYPDGRRAAVCTWDGDVWRIQGIDAPRSTLGLGQLAPLKVSFFCGRKALCQVLQYNLGQQEFLKFPRFRPGQLRLLPLSPGQFLVVMFPLSGFSSSAPGISSQPSKEARWAARSPGGQCDWPGHLGPAAAGTLFPLDYQASFRATGELPEG